MLCCSLLWALEENYVIKQTCEFWTQAERRKLGPLHNAPNEVAGGSFSPGWALCSLFTICLMTEWGLPSAPALPNEPQREITGSIVARHRSLALISPNKPVSSQDGTHPSTASQEPHTAQYFSPSLSHYVIRVTWSYHPLKYSSLSLSLLFVFSC